MMKRIDNIVIGELVEGVTLEMLGVLPDEVTLQVTEDDAREMNFFLPKILADVGVFQNTSEIKRIHETRQFQTKLSDDERFIWRNLNTPELTRFKIGKKLFWLIVGEFK